MQGRSDGPRLAANSRGRRERERARDYMYFVNPSGLGLRNSIKRREEYEVGNREIGKWDLTNGTWEMGNGNGKWEI